MNIYLLLSGLFFLTLILGKLIEKIRIPWIFSALFIGLFVSLHNPFQEITSSITFTFLAQLGMYFLLFIIGFDLDVKELLKQGKFITTLSFSLVFTETVLGTLIIHYIFAIDWGIAILVASSFSTVGEAVLAPILDEFKIIKTRFGQAILGVGTLDDVIEIVTVIVASLVLGGAAGHPHISFINSFVLLSIIFFIPLFLLSYQKKGKLHHFKFHNIPLLFLFTLFLIFLFVGIGDFIEAAALGSLLAGVSLKTLLKKEHFDQVDTLIRTLSYGFFIPIFFMWVGLEVNMNYLLTAPLLVLLILLATNTTKILTTLFVARKKFGVKKSILMGIGLSAKFSTSIVIITMLYNNQLIPVELYSVLIGAMIASKFIIPVLFSQLILFWKLQFVPLKKKTVV